MGRPEILTCCLDCKNREYADTGNNGSGIEGQLEGFHPEKGDGRGRVDRSGVHVTGGAGDDGTDEETEDDTGVPHERAAKELGLAGQMGSKEGRNQRRAVTLAEQDVGTHEDDGDEAGEP